MGRKRRNQGDEKKKRGWVTKNKEKQGREKLDRGSDMDEQVETMDSKEQEVKEKRIPTSNDDFSFSLVI